MRILKATITVLFTIYAFNMFGNGTNTETRDTFIVSNEIELDLMKSYVTIQVLKEINIKQQDCFDDSNLNTFIQVLNNHLKKHPQTSLIVYTDEITATIINLINNNLEYKLASDRLIEKYHQGLIVDLKPTTKIAINH